VKLQTSVKNRIHALLAQAGIHHPFSDLFGKAGKKFLQELELDQIRRLALRNYLAVLDVLQAKIKETSAFLANWVRERKDVALLESIPGVGTYAALLILSEIGDIQRFPNGKKLCAYAGLVPRVHQSDETHRYGEITKEGSSWLRWILIQAVHQAIRVPNALQRFHARLARKQGNKIAVVATARKLLLYIYQMLRWEVRFEELRVNQARAPR
jgi:transposase